MTITDSARGPKTSLGVFPDIRALFTHSGNTQKHVFDIPDHVPYYDLVRGWDPTNVFVPKKTLLGDLVDFRQPAFDIVQQPSQRPPPLFS